MVPEKRASSSHLREGVLLPCNNPMKGAFASTFKNGVIIESPHKYVKIWGCTS